MGEPESERLASGAAVAPGEPEAVPAAAAAPAPAGPLSGPAWQRRTRGLHRRLGALVFLSGLCALVYQVVWLRELRLVFGASTPASAAVLAIFMGGLGLGGWLLGRRAQASPRPLGLYGGLEAGVALSAGVTPWTVGWVADAYHALGGSAAMGWGGAAVVRLLLATAVLGLPTFLMGGTLPAIVRAATAEADRGRRSLGYLYGVNTLGAVMGVTLTTFLLLEALGQRRTLWVAALVNLLVALTARAWSREGLGAVGDGAAAGGASEEPVPRREALAVSAPEEGGEPAAELPGNAVAPVPAVLGLAAAVGFVFFLMEIAWYRMLSPLLGGSTYTFGVILLGALAGIGAGGLLYGAGDARRRPSLARFAGTCALEALLLVLPLAAGPRLAVLAQSLRGLEALGFSGLVAGWLVLVALVVVPVSVVAGYQFPLLVALLGAGGRQVSRHTGQAYAANTFGAIAGSLAGGFGLLPLLSAPGVWRLATALLGALALLSLGGAWLGSRRSRVPGTPRLPLLPAATAVAAIALCFVPGPGAAWRHGQVGVGRGYLDASSREDLRRRLEMRELTLLWEADGRESSVGVVGGDGLTFIVNGKADGNARGDAATQVMSPLVPTLLHPAPRRGLVIGLGTGSSAGWLAKFPGMERVDVVELEPVIARFAEQCAAVNQDAMGNPVVQIAYADGREYLLTSDAQWDLVFSEPSNPYRAGIASLFTREFYEAAADRLAPGGIFVQWLQAYEVDAEVIATVYATLGDVFPHVETWAVHDLDLLLVASREPLRHDADTLTRRLAAEPYRSALPAVWGVEGLDGLYSGWVAGPGFARRVRAGTVARNLDDRPVIEFGFARGFGRPAVVDELRAAVRPDERVPDGAAVDWAAAVEARQARAVFFGQGREAGGRQLSAAAALPPGPERDEAAARHAARAAAAVGDLAGAAQAWSAQSRPPRHLVDLLLVSEGWAELADPRAVAAAESLRQQGRVVEAEGILARYLLRAGRPDEAVAHLAAALRGLRSDPWPWPAFAARTLALVHEPARDPRRAAALLEPLGQPFAVRVLEFARSVSLVRVAASAGGPACVPAYRRFEPHPFWSDAFLRGRAECYARAGDPLADRARRDLDRFFADRRTPFGELAGDGEDSRGEPDLPAEAAWPVARGRD